MGDEVRAGLASGYVRKTDPSRAFASPPPVLTTYIHTRSNRTAFLRLSRSYFEATGDAACFHYVPAFEQQAQQSPLWLRAVEAVLDVVQASGAVRCFCGGVDLIIILRL